MAIATAAELLALLRQLPLLTPAQFDDVARKMESKPLDARTLAHNLIETGWLTPYQVNQLLQGRGKSLLLGSYIVLERLGEGGMGEVFKARHRHLNNLVALKLIHKDRMDNSQAIKRFQREIHAAARLHHPNIILAYDADQIDSRHFLTMEYVEGIDLHKLVKDKGPLPIEQACDYIRQAALGLQHAFDKGMVHRDIKPHNLLLAKTGTIKILDMGLARVIRPDGEEASSSTLTREGSVMGTLDYIAPEQAMDSHTADIRADLYSLGCTFYFLLTGKVPFPGGDALAKLMKHKLEEPVPVEKLRIDLPPGLASVLRKLMAKQPEQRFQTPAELAAVLASGTAASSPGAALHRAARRRWLVRTTAVTLILFSLLGLVGFLLIRGSDATTRAGKTIPESDPGPPPLAVAPFDEKQAKEHQRRWAEYLKVKVVEANSIGMKLAVIPPGKFAMGSPDNETGRLAHEGPQHEVELTQPFSIGVYEVTLGQYRAFIKDSGQTNDGTWAKSGLTDEHPVAWVTWSDAEAFCQWLSKKEGKKYALPTEAQWEYSCRAGSPARFRFGDDDTRLVDYGWSKENSGGKTNAVGQKKANAWGLHDMHGNVWEWCSDWYKADHYKERPKKDPSGPSMGTNRVLRGGCWLDAPSLLRSAYRLGSYPPTLRTGTFGFRVVLLRSFLGRSEALRRGVRGGDLRPHLLVAMLPGMDRQLGACDGRR